MPGPGWEHQWQARTGSRARGRSRSPIPRFPRRVGPLGGCSGRLGRIVLPRSWPPSPARLPPCGQRGPLSVPLLARPSTRQDRYRKHWYPPRPPMHRPGGPQGSHPWWPRSHPASTRTHRVRPPLRRHHDSEKQTTATELVIACTSPTRASASSVSTQSDTPLATTGSAVSTPRPTKVRAALVLLRPMRSNTHALVHSPMGSCTSMG